MLELQKTPAGIVYPQDLSAVQRFFSVAKRIALFLARTSSQHTIDHLVYEISQQIFEEEQQPPAVVRKDMQVTGCRRNLKLLLLIM